MPPGELYLLPRKIRDERTHLRSTRDSTLAPLPTGR
jgi:hypothetical protein